MGPRVGSQPAGALLHDVEDVVGVEGEAQALPDLLVGKGGVSLVEREVDRLVAGATDDFQLLVAFELCSQVDGYVAGNHVDFVRLEGSVGRPVIGDDSKLEHIDEGRVEEVVLVGFQPVGGAGLVVDHAVWAGADGERGDVGSRVGDAVPDVLGKDREVTAGKHHE